MFKGYHCESHILNGILNELITGLTPNSYQGQVKQKHICENTKKKLLMFENNCYYKSENNLI